MSKLGFLENLLHEAAVTWTPLGELGDLVRGNGLPKSDFTETGVPAIHYGQIYTFYGLSTEKTVSFVSPETAAGLKKVDMGDVVITNTSENFEDVGTPLVYFGQEQAVTGGHATIFKPKRSVLGKYFAYFTQTPVFEKNKRKYAKGTKVIDVSAKDLAKILIPIPCPDDPDRSLAIQAEIVRILDSFTELTTELTAGLTTELETRRKQYEFYSRELLSFGDDDAEWTTLGEIASIGTGSRNTNEAVPNGKYPFFVRSQEPRAIDEFEFDDTAIITAGDGVGVGKVFHYMSGKYALHQRAYRIVVTDARVLSKYLFHYIRKNFGYYLRQTSVHASVTSLRMPMFQKYPVPIPKEEGEQARIIATLDKFDTVMASLGDALPREIELRRLQYEYYRDLLFSFPKPEGAA